MDNPINQLGELLRQMHSETRKVEAADQMVHAGQCELQAAMMVGDRDAIEKARVALVARFEASVDVKIASHQHLEALQRKFGSGGL